MARICLTLALLVVANGLAAPVGGQPVVPKAESPLDQALEDLQKHERAPKHAHNHAHPETVPAAPGPSWNPVEMLGEFVHSWHMFGHTYLAGWLIAALLALVGVFVVARNQIFFGLAVSEASTLGIAVGLVVTGAAVAHGATEAAQAQLSLWAVGFSIAAALATAQAHGRETHEALTGWVFLVSASLSIVIVAHSPHGLLEIQRIHSSSIIGASVTDVVLFAAFAAASGVAVALLRRRLLLIVMDPELAAAAGLRPRLWNAVLLIWLGLAVGLSIRTSGTVYTFGCLVLPALIAKPLCREAWMLFVAAPLIAVTTAAVGFVVANHMDTPPAQLTVALLAGIWLLEWLMFGLRGLLRGVRNS